ncbi:iron-containing redox enzyme family protein [Chromobacterium vaccinii]|nr:iron-containing redox enzyme family protein [Chromobacterium vaccinii]MBX9355486.1 iron-containing redox enzyme family protein [Chromobacterium vaccinii]
MDWRQAYRLGADPESWLDEADILQWMANMESEEGPAHPLSTETLAAWRVQEEARYAAVDAAVLDGLGRERHDTALLACAAPLAMVLGSWLQGLSAPGVFEDDGHLGVLALLADDLGTGRPLGARTDAFRLLLRRFNHPFGSASAVSITHQTSVADDMFALPAVLLAMSRRSDAFQIQILAIDAVFRGIGRLPCFAAMNARHPEWTDWKRLDLSVPGDTAIVAEPLSLSLSLGERCQAEDAASSAKYVAAFQWAFAAVSSWSRRILSAAARAASPAHAMGQLLRDRSRAAGIYHQDRAIEGCPLSEHLRRAASDPAPVMAMLSRSRYVVKGDAARSTLVNGLVSPRGPMFRVFSEPELQTIREWISKLEQPTEQPLADATPALPVPCPPSRAERMNGDAPSDLRSAYHLLQGRAMAPATRAFALAYVRRWLHAAQRAKGTPGRQLPALWSPGTLPEWLLRQHDLHGASFEAGKQSQSGPPSREEVIESTLQLAPLILIDGSWLQGFTDIGLATSEIGAPLFQIYWDELGNGQLKLNHPLIYRQLLRSMDIQLPPTASREFAADPRLRRESFQLPVLWLCLGKLPRTFLPEVLGMNLAMELSGVGDGYRDARRFLSHHGFSTQFVDLHNTIDNVVNGHSAWAMVAIDKYMEGIADAGESSADAWRRIRTGYAALSARPRDFLAPLKSLFASAKASSPPLPSGRQALLHSPIPIV